MFCTNCGKEIGNDSVFCGYCGAGVQGNKMHARHAGENVLVMTQPFAAVSGVNGRGVAGCIFGVCGIVFLFLLISTNIVALFDTSAMIAKTAGAFGCGVVAFLLGISERNKIVRWMAVSIGAICAGAVAIYVLVHWDWVEHIMRYGHVVF